MSSTDLEFALTGERLQRRTLVTGARWLTISTFVVGGLNYAYALILARMLGSGEYAQFAAGQALLLTAGTVASASIPWVLAQQLAKTSGRADVGVLVRFAFLANFAQGAVAAAVIFVVSLTFTQRWTSATLALGAFLIFASSTSSGWLQGQRRFRALAILKIIEVSLKFSAGVGLAYFGRNALGPLGAFGAGALTVLFLGCYWLRREILGKVSFDVLRGLWRNVVGVASIQGLVSILASVDLILVAALPLASVQAASYQASMILSRVPLFIGGAVAIAAFPLVARTCMTEAGVTLRDSLRLYLLTALPFSLALATAPARLLYVVFPHHLTAIREVLPWTAFSGVMIGGVELVTTFYQAQGKYVPSLWRQAVGLIVAVCAIVVGWRLGGIIGISVGALVGSTITMAGLLLDSSKRWPRSVSISLVPVGGAVGLWIVLHVLARFPAVWLAACAVGACLIVKEFSGMRFGKKRDARRVQEAASRRSGCLRILHLGFEDHRRPGSGGGSMRNFEINSRLSERHDITVLTANYRGARRRVENGVTYMPIGLPLGYFPSLITYFLCVPFAALRHRSDLVVEEFAAPISSMAVPLWTRRPTLAVVQWMNSREKSRQYRLPFFLFETLGVRSHRQFIAVSDGIKSRILSSNLGARVTVIPNGVDKEAFAQHTPRGPDIVYLGRLEIAQKGLDLLIRAFARISADIEGGLVLAGDGPDRRALQNQCAAAGILDRVTFVGRVGGSDKFALLAAARVVVMPSRYETFGIVAVESLAAGTPVIAFDIPCLSEVVPDSCGRLVTTVDDRALAEAIREMYGDVQQIDEMGSNGREYARRFDWDVIALEQERIYLRVAKADSDGLTARTSSRVS